MKGKEGHYFLVVACGLGRDLLVMIKISRCRPKESRVDTDCRGRNIGLWCGDKKGTNQNGKKAAKTKGTWASNVLTNDITDQA